MNLKRFSPAASLCTLLVASFLGSSHLQAGSSNKSGNPYGNGSFFPDSGTFSAIIRGTNGFLGVVQFSTTDPSSTNSLTNSGSGNGVATIYAEGAQFIGSAYGALDSGSSTIAATYQAFTPGYQVVESYTVTSNSVVEVGGSFFYAPVTYTTNATYTYTNAIFGQFSANLQNDYPLQVFSGDGQASVSSNSVTYVATTNGTGTNAVVNYTPFLVTTNYTINNTVTGSRLTQ